MAMGRQKMQAPAGGDLLQATRDKIQTDHPFSVQPLMGKLMAINTYVRVVDNLEAPYLDTAMATAAIPICPKKFVVVVSYM
eukprot:COSAG05_NODE_5_length_47078_cov_547.868814_35_plen_81_part_00